MSKLAEGLRDRLFRAEDHPNRIYERAIAARVGPDSAVLDAGCGRVAFQLAKLSGKCRRLIGVDLVDFDPTLAGSGLELLRRDLSDLPLESGSVDLVISRSVLEHIRDIEPVYREIHRVLKPGGSFFFLVPNFWDYVSLISWLVPNRLHGWIVARTEGREARDTFPAFYRSNSRVAVERLAARTGFRVADFRYLGQYPAMFLFNAPLFLAASAYEKLISRVHALRGLRGWILVDLVKAGG